MTSERGYAPHEWLAARIERRPSPIAGRGLFVTAPIAAGETLIIWGGTVFTRAEVEAGKVEGWVAIDEDRFLGAPACTTASMATSATSSTTPATATSGWRTR